MQFPWRIMRPKQTLLTIHVFATSHPSWRSSFVQHAFFFLSKNGKTCARCCSPSAEISGDEKSHIFITKQQKKQRQGHGFRRPHAVTVSAAPCRHSFRSRLRSRFPALPRFRLTVWISRCGIFTILYGLALLAGSSNGIFCVGLCVGLLETWMHPHVLVRT